MSTKRKGDNGSPCRMPLEGEKGREGTPSTRIEKKDEEVRFKIQFTQSWSKPKEFKIEVLPTSFIKRF
jgi:hypothetical protein